MIDRPAAAQGPAQPPLQTPPPAETPRPEQPKPARRGYYLGPLKITPAVVLVAIAIVGSLGFILYVVFRVEDEQIPLLGAGFAVLGASFAAIAIGSLVEMWRAASRVRTGRAVGLAFLGGIAGLAAIGCFTFTVLSTMVWNS